MKYIRTFLILAIAILSISSISVSAQTYVSGKAPAAGIERKIFKEIVGLPYYGAFDHIGYTVNGSTVTLVGKVAVARNKKDAEHAVEDIPGVERVVNNIEILPLSPFDNSIRRRIVLAFANHGGVLSGLLQEPNPEIRIIVENGHVSLEGHVMNRGDYNLANILANGVSGVFSVQNNLIIGRAQV